MTEWYTQLGTLTWTYAATNRLLFEAGVSPGASPDTILAQPDRNAGIPIVEQGGGVNPLAKPMTYRSSTAADMYDNVRQQSYKASASYVTGAHSAKFGMDLQRGHFNRNNFANPYNDIQIRTLDFVPNQVTIFAPLAGFTTQLNRNLGLYAQDRWTRSRLTLSGGIRFDLQKESVDAFTANTTRWTPNRTNSYAEVTNVPNWKDVNPRVSVAYDLFGNGKTAIKASASRGVEQDSIRYADANNPGTDGSDLHAAELDRQQPQLLSRLQPAQFSRSGPDVVRRRRLRRLAERELRQLRAGHVLRSGGPERVGRAPVELGVLDQRSARAPAAGVRSTPATTGASWATSWCSTTRRSRPATSCRSA